MLDLAIIGSGPAALTAALYAARGGLSVKVFERGNFGGTLPEIAVISNYPGFDGEGSKLAAFMHSQAEQAGAVIAYGECTALAYYPAGTTASPGARTEEMSSRADHTPHASSTEQSYFELTVDAEPVQARAVLAASGSEPLRLPFEVSVPVSYCAICDGPLARGQHVAVIGGANSAAGEALYLSGLAADVTLITHSRLKADQAFQQRLFATPNIKIRENIEPDAALLNQFDHIFVYIGKRPATAYLQELNRSYPLLDQQGYVLTGSQGTGGGSAPASSQTATTFEGGLSLQTAIPGLFAAGDVRSGAVRQVVTAAGEGAVAALAIIAHA